MSRIESNRILLGIHAMAYFWNSCVINFNYDLVCSDCFSCMIDIALALVWGDWKYVMER